MATRCEPGRSRAGRPPSARLPAAQPSEGHSRLLTQLPPAPPQAAAQQYLQAVERAAQAVDVPAILAALQAPPPPGACPEDAQQPGLVSRAAAAAARRLARTAKPAYAQVRRRRRSTCHASPAASGAGARLQAPAERQPVRGNGPSCPSCASNAAEQPTRCASLAYMRYCRRAWTANPAPPLLCVQAFVEMCMDRRLLTPQQAVPAVDAVMQAYERQQDWHGVGCACAVLPANDSTLNGTTAVLRPQQKAWQGVTAHAAHASARPSRLRLSQQSRGAHIPTQPSLPARPQVIAAAMRFLTGAAPRAATNPHLVGREQGQVGADAAALVGQRLFRACGRAAEPTTLQAAWHQLAPLVCWQGQQPPWPLVQQLLSACVECDLAACGVQLPDGGGSGGASSSAAGAGGGRVRQEEQRRLLAGQGGVAGVVFDPHSHYSEAVADLMARCAGDQQPVHHDHQQQQPEQQERRANGPVVPSHAAPSAAGGPRVPASNDWGAQQGLTLQALGLGSSCAPGAPPQPLLPTAAQVALLRLAASADEVDLLLGSRLISSRGAWAPDARLLQQQQRPSEGQQPGGGGGAGAAASDVARLQQLARQHAHADGSGNAIALAPRQLPVDFGHLSERAATAAVAAYASVCAWHKAAAVAQAALDGPGARAGPHAAHRTRPLQKLVRRQAAAGNLLAALNGMRQLQRLAPLPPRGGRAVKAQGDEQQLVPEERQQGRPGRAYVAPWTVAACLRWGHPRSGGCATVFGVPLAPWWLGALRTSLPDCWQNPPSLPPTQQLMWQRRRRLRPPPPRCTAGPWRPATPTW